MFLSISLNFLVMGSLSNSNDFTVSEGCNHTVLLESQEREEVPMFYIPGDKWTTEAIKDIAYYLRNHKFNSWDNRYYEKKPKDSLLGFFSAFPNPQLQSLHWEVKANCHKDFYKCISYLYSIVNTAPYSRIEDSVIINASVYNEVLLNRLYYECKERHLYANKIGLPFDDPLEKFQWSVTASYYMCWYTMLGTPALSMLGENCDNFANCWDTFFGNYKHDPRADDSLSFRCAMYSFCPDPCCPVKRIESIDSCYNIHLNPCYAENTEEDIVHRECYIDRNHNQSFKDLISNKWNISCNCRKGFMWTSKFGMCVDVNECLQGTHNCDNLSQNCINIPGTFLCICKWEFELAVNATLCLKRNTTFLN